MFDMISKGDAVNAYLWGTAAADGAARLGRLGGVRLELGGEVADSCVAGFNDIQLVARDGRIIATRCMGCRELLDGDLTVRGWLCERCRARLAEIAATVPGPKSEEKAGEAHAAEGHDSED